MNKADLADDDPTDEEEVLEFDGAATDQLNAPYRIRVRRRVPMVLEASTATIVANPVGNESPRAPSPAIRRTFDHFRTLNKDALQLADDAAAERQPASIQESATTRTTPYTGRNDPPDQGSSEKPEQS